jgi:hypothetical protein
MEFSCACSWRKSRKLQFYTLSRAKSAQVLWQGPSEFKDTRDSSVNRFNGKEAHMKIKDRVYQLGATGYILLWLLGIPIPILLLIFLLRGCN